jgi:pyruvate formate lyase activating enzyme
MRTEALYGEKTPDGFICRLCPHECRITENKCGFCGVRCVHDGLFVTRNFGEVSSIALDPVEKKPLFHYYPGRDILSIGTVGCNARCPYCQNWRISQSVDTHTEYFTPLTLIDKAKKKQSIGIAYTYSEPIVWIEFVMSCSKAFRLAGLKNVMVSNGCINEKPLDDLMPYIDAWNIDLKTFNPETSRKIHHIELETVKRTIVKALKTSHVELTTLIVPGINDSMDEMKELVDWIASTNDRIPWHVSRYFPNYKYDREPTDIQFMIDVYDMAREKLKYVYLGNIAGHARTHGTVCPSCGELLVFREGYSVTIGALKNNKCTACGAAADFIS